MEELNILATLVAAFAGAWGAFLLESTRKKREQKNRQRAVANRALYVIYEMWEVMYHHYVEIIKPYKGKHDAWFNMAATAPYFGQSKFDVEGLAFLLDMGEHVVYPKIILEEMRYRSVLDLIERRNEVLMKHVRPALSAANIKVGTPLLTEEYIETVIGIDNQDKLKKWSPEIMKQVEENLTSLKVAHDDLRAAMKRLQPKTKFINVEFLEI